MSRASLAKDPNEVAAMFDRVAARYDITNDVLSAGRTRVWRRAVVDAVAAGDGDRVLDLAAGTGTSSLPMAAAGAFVVPCDFSLGMLLVGASRQPALPFVAGGPPVAVRRRLVRCRHDQFHSAQCRQRGVRG
jgi:demethylmenaquinone methyltransferase/2-methoxy-6-polyprenyl-1,4-benzoquinol methylase